MPIQRDYDQVTNLLVQAVWSAQVCACLVLQTTPVAAMQLLERALQQLQLPRLSSACWHWRASTLRRSLGSEFRQTGTTPGPGRATVTHSLLRPAAASLGSRAAPCLECTRGRAGKHLYLLGLLGSKVFPYDHCVFVGTGVCPSTSVVTNWSATRMHSCVTLT